ncbi:hypothetical protein RUM43_007838 [Polyplax serrata]|uniref:Uncharacterized protein n=1 Tax=Polyplax serrata TaxID=468196 RepID=A0AAN8P694_POLSC
MDHDDCLLDSFTSSVIQYLNEILIHKNCVPNSFRKNSVKNEKDVEFSFNLRSSIESIVDCRKRFYPGQSYCLTEEEVSELKVVSQCWCLHLIEVSFREGRHCLKLDRPHTFNAVIKLVLSKKSDYGKRYPTNQVCHL